MSEQNMTKEILGLEKKYWQAMIDQDLQTAISQFDEKNAQVRLLGPDMAVVAYKVHSRFGAKGKDREMDAVDTSTWVKRGDKWVCAMHTETELAKEKH